MSTENKLTTAQPPALAQFILRHWRGNYSIARSFWVNYIAIYFCSLVLFTAFSYVLNRSVYSNELAPFIPLYVVRYILEHTHYPANAFMLLMSVALVWQIVGLYRSAAHAVVNGQKYTGYFVQFLCVLLVIGNMWSVATTSTITPVLLSDEVYAQLLLKADSGDQEARDKIITHMMSLVRTATTTEERAQRLSELNIYMTPMDMHDSSRPNQGGNVPKALDAPLSLDAAQQHP